MKGIIILCVIAITALSSCTAKQDANTKKPNIVFMMSDDHQAFAMGCMGNTEIETPNLDKLAGQGILFKRCYATSPLCMASRATVMTGMYEYKTGCNFQTGAVRLSDWKSLAYPVLLKEAGYRTAFAGKWGFFIGEDGRKSKSYDPSKDFDKWGALLGGQGYYATEQNPNMKEYAAEYPHVTRALGKFGCDFIKQSVKTGQPFCLSLSFKAPHKPHNQIDIKDQNRYAYKKFTFPVSIGKKGYEKLPIQAKLGRQYFQRHEWDEMHYQDHIKSYYQLISGVDAAVGMVREALDEMGIADNTIIIYTADNGYFCGSHGLQGKVLPYENASRIPLIVYDPRKPAQNKGVKSEAIVANIDFSPTILDLAGVKIPQKMDGQSLLPLINGSKNKLRNELGIIQNWDWSNRDMTKALAVVTDEWKYIYWCYADENIPVAEELFNLTTDPDELNNVAFEKENKTVLNAMQEKYDAFHKRWVENCVDGPFYKRFGPIADRHLSWHDKNFNTQTKERWGEFLSDIYTELTGAEYPHQN